MSPARASAALGIVVALATSACSSGAGRACTLIGGRNVLTVSLAPSVRAELARLDVELCQEGDCARVGFGTEPRDARSLYVRKGVMLGGAGSYQLEPRAFGRPWEPDVTAPVVVRGVGPAGRTVVRHAESFRFEKTYPNGKECDDTAYLSHTTRIGARDRTDGRPG